MLVFFFQAEDGIRDWSVTGVQTCTLPISLELVIRLEVGNIAETVEVHGGTPLLETASSTIGQVMDERRMLELPQKGGNPLELARLAPGVANLTNLRTMKSSSPSGTSQSSVD